MKLNRELFWNKYKKSFDSSISQPTTDALNYILDRFEDDKRLKFISEYSYVLATAYHESGLAVRIGGKKVIQRFVPVKEGKGSANSEVWIKYQSKYWNTGFYGRGFVQITHKDNYAKIGELLNVGDLFVKNPDLMLEIKWAYEALVLGMYSGLYRSDKKGKQKLSRYFKEDRVNLDTYYEAREIINGDKKKNGMMIAQYADKFESILFECKISDEVIEKPVEGVTPTEQPTQTNNTTVEVNGEQPTNVNIFNKLDDLSDKADKVNQLTSKVSSSSVFTFVWKQLLAIVLFIYGAFKDNWEWVVIGVIVLLIAAYLWNEAKKRNMERQIK